MRASLLSLAFVVASSSAFVLDAPQKVADAKPGEVRLFVSTGLKAPLESVRSQAQAAVGHPLVIEYGASRTLRAEIEGGQAFEVAVLTPDVINDMIAKGRIVAGSATDIGHVGVAVAVKGEGAPHVDAGDPVALKALLLGAKTVRYLGIGASAPTVQKIFTGLGVSDATKDKVVIDTASQMATASAGAGEYEVLINLNSELHPINGWTILGLAPKQFQVPVTLTAGIGAGGDAEAAHALIRFLSSPTFTPALRAGGMTR